MATPIEVIISELIKASNEAASEYAKTKDSYYREKSIRYKRIVDGISNLSFGGSGVTSFNTRTGAVTLTSSDVITALGYTPSSGTPTLDQVTTAGNTTANAITVGSFTSQDPSGVYSRFSATTNTSYPRGYFYIGSNLGDSIVNAGLSVNPDVSSGVQKNTFLEVRTNPVNSASTMRFLFLQETALTKLVGSSNDANSAGSPMFFTTQGIFATTPAIYIGNTAAQNVLIGTTTDAGYKLDVNGTFRTLVGTETNPFRLEHTNGNYMTMIVGAGSALAAGQFGMYFNGTPMWSWNGATFRLHGNAIGVANNPNTLLLLGGYGGSTVGTSIKLASNTYNQGQWTATSGTQTTVEIGSYSNETWAPSSGNASYTLLSIAPRINTSGTYAGIVRGLYYNPTLTSLTGTDHRAIETTAGNVIFSNAELSVSDTGTSGVTHNLLFRNDNNAYGGIRISSTGQDLGIQQGGGYGYLSAAGFSIGSTNGTIWTNNGSIFRVVNPAGTTNYFTIHDTTGNVSINSSTDAGYKLDVNGSFVSRGNAVFVSNLNTSSSFSTAGIHSDGRMALYGTDPNGTIQLLAHRGAYAGGAATLFPGNVSAAGLSGAIGFQNSTLALQSFLVGNSAGGGTQKPLVFGTPNTAVLTGFGGNTDTVDIATVSIVSNTFGGTRPSITYTALAHNFKVNNGTGQNNVGTSVLYLDSTGNVGIGTTAPAGPLHVKYSSSTLAGITIENDGVGFNAGSMTLRSGTSGGVNMSVTSGGGLYWYNLNTFSNSLSLPSTGNLIVGGAVDAGYRLDVKGGNARFEQNVEAASYSVAGNAGYSGIVNFPSNPPGSQNLEFLHGILINVF